MTKHDWFIDLGYEIAEAYQIHFIPAIQVVQDAEDWDWRDLRYMQFAELSPTPLTVGTLTAITPYMAEASAVEALDQTAHRGYIEAVDGGYRTTDRGREIIGRVAEISGAAARSLDGSLGADAAEIADIVTAIAKACFDGAECPTPSLSMSLLFTKPEDPALDRMRRALNALYTFRDDAHHGAWRAQDVHDGGAWEAFSHVWGGNIWGEPIKTAAEAAEKFGEFRGYVESDYSSGLDAMVERGWLTKDGDAYSMTSRGIEIREAAEAETDRLYFRPWGLDETQGAELRGRMERLRDALKSVPVPQPA